MNEPQYVAVPGDKSLSHRAIMIAALARGSSRVSGVLASADVMSTAECMRRLGVAVPALADAISIVGAGASGLRDPAADLDCGNSGTSVRLLSGIVAGAGRSARFIGDDSLSKRPMRRVSEPLTKMGARFEFERGDGLPMRAYGGALSALDWTSKSASAQVKSALLLAGLAAGVPVTVHEPSKSRDHTERMLGALGVPVHIDGNTVALTPAGSLRAFEFDVPGDPSSAAFFAAWALLTGRPVRTNVISTNKTRTGFLDLLNRMGGNVVYENNALRVGEPVGTVTISGALNAPVTLGHESIASLIDELPLLGCLAAYAPGTTQVTGAGELRLKESDRIAALVSNLAAVGVRAEELPDGFVVHGEQRALRGAVRTFADHRIAMAFGILSALPGNDIVIDDRDCVAVSYPGFWDDLRRVSRE